MPTRQRARNTSRSGELTHLDARGQAQMVDVAEKAVTTREAIARVEVHMQPATLRLLRSGRAAKGDVLAVARVAGIQAAKRTPELIPLCHSIALTRCEVQFGFKAGRLMIETRVRATDRTGVEMEALTAAAVAALTVYDMLKAVDRGMTIRELALHEKRGGRSGEYRRF